MSELVTDQAGSLSSVVQFAPPDIVRRRMTTCNSLLNGAENFSAQAGRFIGEAGNLRPGKDPTI
jgi:hypothetical protein